MEELNKSFEEYMDEFKLLLHLAETDSNPDIKLIINPFYSSFQSILGF